MKILLLGGTGMIGHTMARVLAENQKWHVIITTRGNSVPYEFSGDVLSSVDLGNSDHLAQFFRDINPDIVINCAGLTKHVPDCNNPIRSISINALLPHRLKELCDISNARLIHISTDCVFSGTKGNYRETDTPNASDFYGQTKALGEVTGNNILTIRTSTIGHEINTCFGLLEWFLGQKECKGFSQAIFSGLSTIELARVVRDYIIPNSFLSGIFHVASEPIDKFQLLQLISEIYDTNTLIHNDPEFIIDRSLNAQKFHKATNYVAPSWKLMIEHMHHDFLYRKNTNV